MMSCAHLGRRAITPDPGPLHLGNVMEHDVGAVVLRHLASTQDSVRICRNVSKECRALVDAHVHSLRANLASICTLVHLPLQFPRLQRLAFDLVSSDTSSLLAQLAQTKPQLLARLKELDLSNCNGLEAYDLAQLLRTCGSSLRSLALPPLSLYVTSTRHDFLQAISANAPQLTCLLGAGDYICPASIQLLPQLAHLQLLHIQPVKGSVKLTPAALQPLAQLSNLQELQLGNDVACYDTFALAAGLPGLTSLGFSYVEANALAPSDVVPLTSSRKLQDLTLSAVTCSDELLAVLASTPVKSLTLSASRFTCSPKGTSVLQHQLTRLQLQVNDTDISALAAALPVLKGLKSLSLAVYRAGVDCTGLLQAIFGLSQLETVSLESHFNGLTESELSNLPVLRQLQHLSLLNHFSDSSLQFMLRSTPQLQRLKLVSCGKVSDTGLGALVTYCKGMREVHLELMRGVTVAGIAALAAAPLVRRVLVQGCRNVSTEECRKVLQATDKCDLDIVKLR